MSISRFEIAPEVGVDGGVTVGLRLRFNIEGRKFKENEEVQHYTIQPHFKQFKVNNNDKSLKWIHFHISVFQIPLADSFYEGIIELFIRQVDSKAKPYTATVRPQVYIIHTNQVGTLIHDEPKTFRTWMTVSGSNPNPHKTTPRINCDFCTWPLENTMASLF